MTIIIGILTTLFFFFVLYSLAKEDFIFLRKNVATEEIFDTCILGIPVVLFCSRLMYVFLHPSLRYLNPLVFFVIPYFPGLSIIGGILGGVGFLYFFTKNKKVPTLRLSDILALAYVLASGIYFLGNGILQLQAHIFDRILGTGIAVLYVVCFALLHNIFSKNRWAEGAIAGCVLILDSLLRIIYLLSIMLLQKKLFITPDIILFLVFFFGGVVFFLLRQRSMRNRFNI